MDKSLEKYLQAYQRDYETALREVRAGYKQSHWMWYIFPQIKGLGRSFQSQKYAINDLEEARAFLKNEYLGKKLIEICQALLALDCDNATEIFHTDAKKLKSSMTLFAYADESEPVFKQVIDKFFNGKSDKRTIKILGL